MPEMIKVFVGFDSREEIAYEVCKHSILKHNKNVKVSPLKQDHMRRLGLYWRPTDPLSSTEFTFTRFLVPALCNYQGWAVFCDCDFIWTEDIANLIASADPKYAVMCVHHDYTVKNTVKMDGKEQTIYPRKNWSSMVLFNCGHPSNQILTADLVNKETGKYLHRFGWLKDEEIGQISHEWNWLVGVYDEPTDGKPRAIHYTEGGPWFDNYRDCEYADVWNNYLLSYSLDIIQKDKQASIDIPITWVTSLSREYWNIIAEATLPTWSNLPGQVVFVWDDKPKDLGFGYNFLFGKDVCPDSDPWIREKMGSYKSDRFWKKSRVQVWAARKFKGLVVWLDADISVKNDIDLETAIKLLHPREKVCGILDCGGEWDVDTGLVTFNTDHSGIHDFISKYSLMWYNGQISMLPQPYDHYAMSKLRNTIPMKTYVLPKEQWKETPTENINRSAMRNSIFDYHFEHHLGIENKDEVRSKFRQIPLVSSKQ